jgi:hypothetical protein
MTANVLLSKSTTGDGGTLECRAEIVTLQASLGAGGGTATANAYGQLSSDSPWQLLCTFDLSGANDSVSYVLDEKWNFLKGNVSAISSATVTIAIAS